jgi:hypothetical protein
MSPPLWRYKKFVPSHGKLWQVLVYHTLLHELKSMETQQELSFADLVHLLGNN